MVFNRKILLLSPVLIPLSKQSKYLHFIRLTQVFLHFISKITDHLQLHPAPLRQNVRGTPFVILTLYCVEDTKSF